MLLLSAEIGLRRPPRGPARSASIMCLTARCLETFSLSVSLSIAFSSALPVQVIYVCNHQLRK